MPKKGKKPSKVSTVPKEKTNYVLVTIPEVDENELEVWKVVNNQCSKTKFGGTDFLKNLTDHLLSLKADKLDGIVFDLFEHVDPKFIAETRKALAKFCEESEIKFRFLNHELLFTLMLLMNSKINFKLGSSVFVAFCHLSQLCCFDIKVGRSFKIVERESYQSEDENWGDMMVKSCKTKTYIFGSSEDFNFFGTLTALTKNTIFMPDDFEGHFVQCFPRLFHELINVPDSRWDLIHERFPTYDVLVAYSNDDEDADMVRLRTFKKPTQSCPYRNVIKTPDAMCVIRVEDAAKIENYGYHIEYTDDGDNNRMIIDVQEDGYIYFTIPLRYDVGEAGDTERMVIGMNQIMSESRLKVPVLTLLECFVFFYAYENGKYTPVILDNSKFPPPYLNLHKAVLGKLVIDCIDFSKEQPVVGLEAEKMKKTKPAFVVYGNFHTWLSLKYSVIFADLFEIMAMDPEDVEQSDEWGFEVIHTGDPNEPLLLQFETFRGTRKATPAFLAVFILKRFAKAYKTMTGKNLDNVLISNPSGKEKFSAQIKTAFDLLNIKSLVG